MHETIDAHHHLWNYRAAEYPWMSSGMESIQRDFSPEDLRPCLDAAGIDGTVAVQARQTIEETEFLLTLAGRYPFIRAVVGWLPLIQPDVRGYLERFSGCTKFRAVRHVLHDETDERYMLRADFNRGVALLPEFDLVYDILVFERHLPQVIEFVDRHPRLVFVLDHIGKPLIRQRVFSPWREHMAELARRENVYCKISGLVTEADWGHSTEAELRPYFDVVLSTFGPQRLMFGSDWPVVLVASSYERWALTVKTMIATLTIPERQRIMGGTAAEAYGL